MANWTKLQDELSNKKRIIIVSHRSPDGDSIGSSLAVKRWMEKNGHDVKVFTPDPAPDFLSWLSGFDSILNYQNNRKEIEDSLISAELLIALDFNNMNRLGDMQDCIEAVNIPYIVNIDHHQEPDDFANFQFSDTTASSTAQMVFEWMERQGELDKIDKELGECIYTGILTDTGSFRFSSTSPKTHQAAAFVLSVGVEPSKINEKIYDSYSVDRLNLLGFALNERFNYYKKHSTGVIYLSENDLNQFNFKKGDTEGIVNYPLSIKEIKVAILITEKDGKVKMSFRSKGDFHVNEIAKKYFNGGGHFNAAGGISDLSVTQTVEKIEKILSEYEAELAN